MNIQKYLQRTLSCYGIRHIKIKAEIELQGLINDRIIYIADVHYTRDEKGVRNGVRVGWKLTEGDEGLTTCDILASDAKESEKC